MVEGEVIPATADIVEELTEQKPLEEIFSLRPDMLQPVAEAADDDEDSDKKKDKKKKKKVVEIVYDETLDKAIAKKKHKRSDGVWEEE